MATRLQSDVLVPLHGMDDFESSLARLNKKAEAFGLDPIKVVATSQQRYYWKTQDTSAGTEAYIVRLMEGDEPPFGRAVFLVNRLSLDYPIVKLGDWSVVGQIEATEAGNLLFSVSTDPDDVEVMRSHANCAINCEHCNTKRARKLSYLLKDRQGNYKEVGSTCLEDFAGVDPSIALFTQQMHAFWSDYGEESFSADTGRVTAMPVKGYLARVLFCMEVDKGFVSAAKAKEAFVLATYERAAGLDRELQRDARRRDRFYQDYERHAQYADKIIAWWLKSENDDSFTSNVKTLFSNENIELKSKYLAFAAGAVAGHQRQHAKERDAEIPSVHVGEVGQKRDEPLTFHSVTSWDTQYGLQWRLNFRDSNGNRLSWRTSSPPDDLLKPQAVDRTFAARFKVKKHGEYKGVAVTEVSHLKVDRWLDAEVEVAPSVAVITIRPDTAAFMDVGMRNELANIVRAVAEQMDRTPGEEVDVCDINGNTVGSISFAEPEQAVADDDVRISIRLSPGRSASEVAALVARAALAGERGVEDENGLVIGAIEIGRAVQAQQNDVLSDESRPTLSM
ncbi:hypothetical protein [Bordetella flabilis]|uniref:Uncharacterized protein n=1 Tax=Bordetella flabilis TaxID=463014 RepID=A0A193GMZ1_9BORD|nr:hypothetical protein [Bordetella flabilis]ANN80861.1 hypothetical protein BAU07_26430 [Bordetella flabilis]